MLWQCLGAVVAAGAFLNEQQKFAAHVAMVLILFLNGFAGRSMEWEHLTRQQVPDQIDNPEDGGKGLDDLRCKVRKTVKQYADVGKWLFEGTKAAMIAVLYQMPWANA